MSGIYLGTSGAVEIERTSINTPLNSVLDPTDVNAPEKRFGFDFDHTALITGDRVSIRSVDGSNLQLVSAWNYPDWTGYIHIDDAGGIRLYSDFNSAINGGVDNALPLIAPAVSQKIELTTEGFDYRYLADISEYQITTSRETVDLTSLGEEHRRSYASGLISGQGTLTCFWQYQHNFCDGPAIQTPELSQYFANLILRVQQGASFHGRFYLLNGKPDYVWYDAPLCIVTNVALTVSSADAIRAQIDFVTSGNIDLHIGQPPAYLLQENLDFVLQESGERIELEDN